MKKLIAVLSMLTFVSLAAPGPGPRPGGPGPGFRHAPAPGRVIPARPAPMPHRNAPSVWGRGGRNFIPGFAGGLIGSLIAPPIVVTPPPSVVVTPPPVVQSPVIIQPGYRAVWVEGRYVQQIQSDGTVIRVWRPGYYTYIQF